MTERIRPEGEPRYGEEVYSMLEKLGFSISAVNKIKNKSVYIPEDGSTIVKKISWLKDQGFSNPIELIEKSPQILGLAEESMGEKISLLKEQNIDDPVKLIERMPQILGFAEESIPKKISWLKEQGFDDPLKLIHTMPQILGFAEETLGKKIHFIKLITSKLTNYPIEESDAIAIKYIEKIPTIVAAKFDKIVLLVRILTIFKKENELPSNYELNILLFSNIDNVILALAKTKDVKDLTIPEFIKVVNDIKKEDVDLKVKREEISKLLEELRKIKSSDDEIDENLLKLLSRYERGYLK